MTGLSPNVTLAAFRAFVLYAYLATATPLHIVAICATALRLHRRYQLGRLWWDDTWAAAALFCDLALSTTPWIRAEITDTSAPRLQRIVATWLAALLFPIVVWTARMSICMSIARLVPPQTRARKLINALAACFLLMLGAILIQKLYVCCKDTSWYHNITAQCYLGTPVAVLNLSTDIVADSCLVAIPLNMLWKVKLPKSQKRLILLIFTSSILNSMAGIVYAVFVIKSQLSAHTVPQQLAVGLSANIKATISLLVCNLLVIVTFVYCRLLKDDEAVTDMTESHTKRTQPVRHSPTFMLTIISLSQTTDSDTGRRLTVNSEILKSSAPPVLSSVMSSLPLPPPGVWQTSTFQAQGSALGKPFPS